MEELNIVKKQGNIFNQEIDLNIPIQIYDDLIRLETVNNICHITYLPNEQYKYNIALGMIGGDFVYHEIMLDMSQYSIENIKIEVLYNLQDHLDTFNNMISTLNKFSDKYNYVLSLDKLPVKNCIANKFIKGNIVTDPAYCLLISKRLLSYDVLISVANNLQYQETFFRFSNLDEKVNKYFNLKIKPILTKKLDKVKKDILVLENEMERINKFIGNYGIFL
jgi:hypothetical protein